MAPIERLIFHIGIPKTGSSLLQKSMRALAEPLAGAGIAYVDRKAFLRIPSYKGWGAYAEAGSSGAEFRHDFARAVDRIRGTADEAPTVLISNEAASGRNAGFGTPFWSRTSGITEIVELLQPARTDIIVYTRRQDRLIESFYMQQIHLGRARTWESFRDRVAADDRIRFTELLGHIEAVPTLDKIRVRPFEIIGLGARPFVTDFLDFAGVGALADRLDDTTLAPSNPSLSHPAWQAALVLNELIETPQQAKHVRRFLHELFPPADHPKAQLFTDGERAALLDTYRAENEAFFRRWLPDHPVDTYSTIAGVNHFRADDTSKGRTE